MQVLFGENEFLKRQKLTELTADFVGEVERIDGESLETGELRELLTGRTLFGDKRLVVIDDMSEGPAWSGVMEIAPSGENEVILLEKKLDKRTKTYKWLQKNARLQEFAAYTERDRQKVVDWCVQRAKKQHNFTLKENLANVLVDRLGYDQLRLDGFLEQLSLAERIDAKLIDEMLPLAKAESVFGLLEAALDGRRTELQKIISYLETESGDDGAYMTLGLLASQVLQLNALVLSGGDVSKVAADLGANPYMLRKLTTSAGKLDVDNLRKINTALSRADTQMKTTNVSPWLLLEAALVEMAQ